MVTSLFNGESGIEAVREMRQPEEWTISWLAAQAVDYKKLHWNIGDRNISPNDKHLILVNSGNDDALREYMETMDTNGGRSSNNNNVTARLGDAMVEGIDRSTADEMLSGDTSFVAKKESFEERKADHYSNDDPPKTVNEVKPPEDTFAKGPQGPFGVPRFG
ncbi:MAG: hypothetical protein OEY94_04315 [Alphaproteobacteria bacterium]|nr:hypothetical protein [Alphaproteobacteria bacterium]